MSLLTSWLLKEESNTLRWSRGQQDVAILNSSPRIIQTPMHQVRANQEVVERVEAEVIEEEAATTAMVQQDTGHT
jgi:hypothetical protein